MVKNFGKFLVNRAGQAVNYAFGSRNPPLIRLNRPLSRLIREMRLMQLMRQPQLRLGRPSEIGRPLLKRRLRRSELRQPQLRLSGIGMLLCGGCPTGCC